MRSKAQHLPPATFHQSDSLLIQFILHEFLKLLRVTKKLKQSLQDENPLPMIRKELICLVGPEHDYKHLFSWSSDLGVLTKMKTYLDLLLHRDSSQVKRLKNTCHEAWEAAILCLEVAKEGNIKTLENYKLLTDQFKNALDLFEKIPAEIKRVLPFYAQDENIVFFLLEHKETLDASLETKFLKQLFHKMYEGGVNQAEAFLIEKYRERGFLALLPIIETKCAELKGFR